MAMLSYTSRREAVEQNYPITVMLLAPLVAVYLQSYLPLHFPRFSILDLPLIVVIYFSLGRRSQVTGAVMGTGVGLLQDALTHLPLGVNGIAKAVVGYYAGSVSVRLDVDNPGTRLLINLIFTLVNSVMLYTVLRFLMNQAPGWHWGYELLRAVLNTLVAMLVFLLLDLFRRRA